MKNIKYMLFFVVLCGAVLEIIPADTRKRRRSTRQVVGAGCGVAGVGCVLISDSFLVKMCGLGLASVGIGMCYHESLRGVYARLDELQQSIDQVKSGVTQVSSQVAAVDTKVTALSTDSATRHTASMGAIEAVKSQVGEVSTAVGQVHVLFTAMQTDFAAFRETQTASNAALQKGQSDLGGQITDMATKMDRNHQELFGELKKIKAATTGTFALAVGGARMLSKKPTSVLEAK